MFTAAAAQVLSGVYVDKDAVDDELVDIILAPAFTPNALDVFVSVITGGVAVQTLGRGAHSVPRVGVHACQEAGGREGVRVPEDLLQVWMHRRRSGC